mgnify:CR=1 FL=1
MTLIKCKECKKEISSSAKTCPHCGYKNEVITCPECGTAVKTTDDVCSECGYPLQKKNPQNIINENLDKITGAKSKSYVTFKDLFKDTFKKHSEEEIDDLFVCGGNKTTPDLKDVDPKKATAWVYFKILVFFIIAYIPTRIGYLQYGNLNFLPAMIMLGAFAVPITVLIFFYEINIFRNIPFYKVVKYFLLGGALSLILAILFFSLDFNTDIRTYSGALMVGVIEEVAKATIVAIFLFRSKKSNYILDGLLIGAAVGAGFAAFETAGYILRYGLQGGNAVMLNTIKVRGFLAPGGHVAWAAIEGAALMYVKGFEKLDKKHLNDRRFLLMCLIPIVLHGIWDMPINSPYAIVQITVSVLAWLVIIYFINLGLKQIDDAKELKLSKSKKEKSN